MTREVIIEPVTRIEGHAKITVRMNDDGQVRDALFHVTEFRGFERFCEGRPFWEMAGITARVCGICPVSHLMASAKTGDALLAVRIPRAAEKLRRMMNLAQIVQSHALSFFHLSSPDMLLGFNADPAQRNIFGLIASDPTFARAGIRLRQFGQTVIELLGGRKIHPAWTVPGGVRSPLSDEGQAYVRERLAESIETTQMALTRFKAWIMQHTDVVRNFGDFPSLYMSLVGADGTWEHYDGPLRMIDAEGKTLAEISDHSRYAEIIGEAVEPWTYLKFPYYKGLGYPQGGYRVGPLARLNICERMGTPLADAELDIYRGIAGRVVSASFYYHYARLIEILSALERIGELAEDPELLSPRVRAEAGVNASEGVGVSEAPRGTLFHHYKIDEHGLITGVNMIIATGQNNLAINETVSQIARAYITGPAIPEEMLNRVEAGVRVFDPCLSCSTHAAGTMPLRVELRGADGALLAEAER